MAAKAAGSVDGVMVAVAQVGATVGDVEANLILADRYAGRAARRGAQLIVFPECFVQGYSVRREVLDLAEPVDGPAVGRLGAIAKRRGIAIVAGMIERNDADPRRPFNTAVVLDASGHLAGSYRKTHLFEGERDAFAAGDAYPVFPVSLGSGPRAPTLHVGVCICRDIEFPEVGRLLALGGAQLIAVPSADMEPWRAQQAANLVCRAIENNLYVALANTVDRRRSVVFFGGSGVAGPDGVVVSAGYGRPRLVTTTLRDAAVAASGGADSYLDARRLETYGGLLAPASRG